MNHVEVSRGSTSAARSAEVRRPRPGPRALGWLWLCGALVAAAGNVGAEESSAVKVEAGVKDFLVISEVLLSPRCRNCHPAGNAPLHGDAGVPHAMNISRRSPDAGLKCQTCHRAKNSPVVGAPPGVPGWHMPSAEVPMVFEGRAPAELCRQLKDPAQTGGRIGQDLEEHLGHDPFVLWAWDPGPGRQPPPISHAELMKRVKGWLDAGAPCPP